MVGSLFFCTFVLRSNFRSEKKIKSDFILYSAHLFVSLHIETIEYSSLWRHMHTCKIV